MTYDTTIEVQRLGLPMRKSIVAEMKIGHRSLCVGQDGRGVGREAVRLSIKPEPMQPELSYKVS
jgi:hypothetical protein